jgi:hypothetical protein
MFVCRIQPSFDGDSSTTNSWHKLFRAECYNRGKLYLIQCLGLGQSGCCKMKSLLLLSRLAVVTTTSKSIPAQRPLDCKLTPQATNMCPGTGHNKDAAISSYTLCYTR